MKVYTAILAAAVLVLLLFLGFSRRAAHQEGTFYAGGDFDALRIEMAEKSIAAPNFTLKDLAGKSVDLHEFRGKVVFLNFWAAWCVPCRAEMPAMERLHREFKDEGLEIVGVNLRESPRQVENFIDELGLTFTVLLDRDGRVSEEYGIWSLPLSYFINRDGEFIGKAIGIREWDGKEGKAFFRKLLDEGR